VVNITLLIKSFQIQIIGDNLAIITYPNLS